MNKIEKLFLYITSTLLFLSMFFMGFSSVCHAESTVLPYLCNNSDYSIDSATAEDIVNKIKSDFPDSDFGDYYIIFCTSESVWQTWWDNVPSLAYRVYFFDYTGLESTWSSGTTFSNFQFNDSSCYMDITCTHVATLIYQQLNERGYTTNQDIGNYSRRLFGDSTPIDISNSFFTFSYQQNYPVYCNADFTTLHLGDGEGSILSNGSPYVPSVPEVGHATQPTNDPNNFINGSNGLPVTRPTSPTINNYTWNTWTSPTVDTSSVESLLESLIDVVSSLLSWLGSNISGEFQNLISNLQNLFDFLVQGIENGFNKVISSIHGLGTDLYNNFVSLFEPITQQLSYISAPFDVDMIQSEVESTSLMSDYLEFVSIKDSFVSVFTDTSEPSTFTIPIHLENLSILNVGTQYIDLSVINPVKSALRTFIWVLVSFGLVVTIIDSIPNYINGGGDE